MYYNIIYIIVLLVLVVVVVVVKIVNIFNQIASFKYKMIFSLTKYVRFSQKSDMKAKNNFSLSSRELRIK